MMVLFVALVVGVSIIQFSKNILLDSEMKLTEISKDPKLDSMSENVIELNPGSNQEFAYLGEACLDRYMGAPDTNICFIVKTGAAPSQAGVRGAWSHPTIPDTNVFVTGASAGTVYVEYQAVNEIHMTS